MRNLFLALLALGLYFNAESQTLPRDWKWISNKEVAFTFDGSYSDSSAFVINTKNYTRAIELPASEANVALNLPVAPEGAVNATLSPDSKKLAYTRDNDLYVFDVATGEEVRITHDGTDLILNGYASWVYYEEILGRSTEYKAFWWSPDGSKIGFYRFDNTNVPLFPIYSHKGQGGSLNNTRYPKAGQENPKVKIAMVDINKAIAGDVKLVWADFNSEDDQYFGTPFWSGDSKNFYISRMPRLQNTLDLYCVSSENGAKTKVYNEKYHTWIDWISGMKFTDKGLYMVRRFETGWQQIYFLSYDGKTFKRMTDGPNWDISIVEVDEKKGEVYFLAKRDVSVRQSFYKLAKNGKIYRLAPNWATVSSVKLSPNKKKFVASYSSASIPTQVGLFDVSNGVLSTKRLDETDIVDPSLAGKVKSYTALNDEIEPYVVADSRIGYDNLEDKAFPQFIYLTTEDGLKLAGAIILPKNFNPKKKYPVHVDIYGGPNTPLVRDVWGFGPLANQWWSDNGIIQVVADPRAGGQSGSLGLDQIYKRLTVAELDDFVAWAKYLKSLPYVAGDKIAVEGFSYGGTMTAMLVIRASEYYHYGNAGGGVFDWSLYDTHYTERYMDTPQNNPEGYKGTKVYEYASEYPTEYPSYDSYEGELKKDAVMLKITHGTGDDNVHFQNALKLIDALHRENKKFEFMIYPDGMHGYRGYQGEHFQKENREFWLKYLLDK